MARGAVWSTHLGLRDAGSMAQGVGSMVHSSMIEDADCLWLRVPYGPLGGPVAHAQCQQPFHGSASQGRADYLRKQIYICVQKRAAEFNLRLV